MNYIANISEINYIANINEINYIANIIEINYIAHISEINYIANISENTYRLKIQILPARTSITKAEKFMLISGRVEVTDFSNDCPFAGQ